MDILVLLLRVVNRLAYLYTILLVVYALLSWFPGGYQSKIGEILQKICEPFLNIFRKLPLQFGGIDFSIMVAIFALNIGVDVISRLIYAIAL